MTILKKIGEALITIVMIVIAVPMFLIDTLTKPIRKRRFLKEARQFAQPNIQPMTSYNFVEIGKSMGYTFREEKIDGIDTYTIHAFNDKADVYFLDFDENKEENMNNFKKLQEMIKNNKSRLGNTTTNTRGGGDFSIFDVISEKGRMTVCTTGESIVFAESKNKHGAKEIDSYIYTLLTSSNN